MNARTPTLRRLLLNVHACERCHHCGDEILSGERFIEECEGAALHRLCSHAAVRLVPRCHQDHRNLMPRGLDEMPMQIEAIHVGKIDVENEAAEITGRYSA